jgi:hypothetical protein
MIQNARIVSLDTANGDYHRTDAKRGQPDYPVSASVLKEFDRCPRRWVDGYQPPESEAKTRGNLMDVMLLTPKQFDDRFAVQPAEYQTEAMKCPSCGSITDSKKCSACKCERAPCTITKPWTNQSTHCKEWLAKVPDGVEVVTDDQVAESNAAISRLMLDQTILGFLAASDVQVALAGEWVDEATGLTIPIRALLDIVPRKDSDFSACLGDLKRTRSAAPRKWASDVDTFGHHIQAALYLDFYNAATGEGRDSFCWILSEQFAPFQTAKRLLRLKELNIAQTTWRRLIGNYCWCLKNGVWPDYDTGETEGPDPEVIQGWGVVKIPWLEQKEMAAPRFGQVSESAAPSPEPMEENDDVPTP